MKDNISDHISPLQFGFLTVVSFISLGIFQFPRELVVNAGPDGFYAFGLECIAAFLALWLYLTAAPLHKADAEPHILHQYLGIASWPLELVAVILHVILAIMMLNNFGMVMRTFFLPGMPLWSKEWPTLVTCFAATWYNTSPLARSLQIVIFPTVFISIAISILVIPHANYGFSVIPSSEMIINKLGLLVVVLWGLFVLAFIAIRLWAIGHYVVAAIHSQHQYVYRTVSGIATLLVGAGAQLITNIPALTAVFQRALLPIFVAYLYAIPLFLLMGYTILQWTHHNRPSSPQRT